MATIGDVARVAGVSRSTVSHALSGKRSISTETKARIAAAIESLGYTANAGARALATSRSNIIGLMVPFIPEEFEPATMQYVLTVAHTAREHGYDVLMVTDREGVGGIDRITGSNLVDGVMVLDVRRHDSRIDHLRRAGSPAVLIGVPSDEPLIDTVDLDFEAAARSLIDHLADLGHRRVLFMTLPEVLFAQDLGYAWRFYDSALTHARSRGIALIPFAVSSEPNQVGHELDSALAEHPSATALLIHNDGALVDLPVALEARGISTPEDLSVVSIFPDQFGRMFRVPYTAVETSAAAVAERAVRMLVARIEDRDGPARLELLAPILVDRGSSGPISGRKSG